MWKIWRSQWELPLIRSYKESHLHEVWWGRGLNGKAKGRPWVRVSRLLLCSFSTQWQMASCCAPGPAGVFVCVWDYLFRLLPTSKWWQVPTVVMMLRSTGLVAVVGGTEARGRRGLGTDSESRLRAVTGGRWPEGSDRRGWCSWSLHWRCKNLSCHRLSVSVAISTYAICVWVW